MRTSKKVPSIKKSESLLDNKFAGGLILDFGLSRAVQNKFTLFINYCVYAVMLSQLEEI